MEKGVEMELIQSQLDIIEKNILNYELIMSNVVDKINSCIELFKDQLNIKLVDEFESIENYNIKITYKIFNDNVLGQTLTYGKHFTILLHPYLLLENPELYIDDIVIHEMAHILTQIAFGSNARSHGKEWKRICKILNPKSDALSKTTNYNNFVFYKYFDDERVTYKCKCDNGIHFITNIKHNKILKGIVTYSCIKCNSDIIYNGIVRCQFKLPTLPKEMLC